MEPPKFSNKSIKQSARFVSQTASLSLKSPPPAPPFPKQTQSHSFLDVVHIKDRSLFIAGGGEGEVGVASPPSIPPENCLILPDLLTPSAPPSPEINTICSRKLTFPTIWCTFISFLLLFIMLKVFVIGPDKKLKLSFLYPASCGRNLQ